MNDNGTVLVAVGTDYHRFDRLMEWVEAWLRLATHGGERPSVVVQHGTSRVPEGSEPREFLAHDELQQLMARASVVVVHGGPATIMEARRHGHRPVVVPRDPALGEHVDSHQMRFARRLASSGLVTVCETQAQLQAALDAWLDGSQTHLLPVAGQADGVGGPDGTGADVDHGSEAVGRVGAIVDDLITARRRRRRTTGGEHAPDPAHEQPGGDPDGPTGPGRRVASGHGTHGHGTHGHGTHGDRETL